MSEAISSHSEGQITTAKVEQSCPGRKIPRFSLSLSRHFCTLNTELSCCAWAVLPKLSLCSADVLTLFLRVSDYPSVTTWLLHFYISAPKKLVSFPNSRLFFQNLAVQMVRLESRSGTKYAGKTRQHEKCKMTDPPWHHILTQQLV